MVGKHCSANHLAENALLATKVNLVGSPATTVIALCKKFEKAVNGCFKTSPMVFTCKHIRMLGWNASTLNVCTTVPAVLTIYHHSPTFHAVRAVPQVYTVPSLCCPIATVVLIYSRGSHFGT